MFSCHRGSASNTVTSFLPFCCPLPPAQWDSLDSNVVWPVFTRLMNHLPFPAGERRVTPCAVQTVTESSLVTLPAPKALSEPGCPRAASRC